ncbi:TetR/AcrR family transcriptional regulator [Nocardioides sp.]|uniref:TetR/AcrR family transcriptional regulator n=1 Tax=Nocardioides sp. TaxID=35761 RepID=UPI001A33ADD9|nr:TetR/AcrR family transcriptional regulator [Nocardioides sp.]MBJ7359634.1 TetR family transcriptional regulator [Nocardioides sp.]
MAREPQTVRSTRTRAALRRAALSRFMTQGVEATSVEQIAADAGVTVRTFYRHFATKHDLLFADYDAGLHWFRAALASRPADEPLVQSVQAAIFAFPQDVDAIAQMTQMAALRVEQLDHDRIVRHLRGVEADFARALSDHLTRREPPVTADEHLAAAVTARTLAAATFAAMETWMVHGERTMAELSRLCQLALDQLRHEAPV